MTSAPGTAASSSSRVSSAPLLRGRKPSKKKCSMGSPEATSAQVTAEGPGMTSTASPASRTASTRRWPGSDTPGIPASETNATFSPRSMRLSAGAMRSAKLCSSARLSAARMPKWDSSLPVTRVSSHKIRSASRSVRRARTEMSSRLPMGVPTTKRVPSPCG